MVLSASGLSKEYVLTAMRHKVITHVYKIILILDTACADTGPRSFIHVSVSESEPAIKVF